MSAVNIFDKFQREFLKQIKLEIEQQNIHGKKFSGGGFEDNTIYLINSLIYNNKPLFITDDGDPFRDDYSGTPPFLSGSINIDFILSDKFNELQRLLTVN